MATYEIIDGERVLLRRTKIPGRDNTMDLPPKQPAKAKAAKAKSKKDEVTT